MTSRILRRKDILELAHTTYPTLRKWLNDPINPLPWNDVADCTTDEVFWNWLAGYKKQSKKGERDA